MVVANILYRVGLLTGADSIVIDARSKTRIFIITINFIYQTLYKVILIERIPLITVLTTRYINEHH